VFQVIFFSFIANLTHVAGSDTIPHTEGDRAFFRQLYAYFEVSICRIGIQRKLFDKNFMAKSSSIRFIFTADNGDGFAHLIEALSQSGHDLHLVEAGFIELSVQNITEVSDLFHGCGIFPNDVVGQGP
jgi:hypothetical protein